MDYSGTHLVHSIYDSVIFSTPSGAQILTAESNGSGGAITTFSHKTFLRSCTFSGNTARLHGGAIAFLEFVASSVTSIVNNSTTLTYVAETAIPSDDGRKAVLGSDVNGTYVNNLTFTYNQVLNYFAQVPIPTNTFNGLKEWSVNECAGGAVYFGSHNFGANVPSTYVSLTLGSVITSDRWVFSGNGAINNQPSGSFTMGAKGGALFADKYTALTMYNGIFLNNRASTPKTVTLLDSNAYGGAIFADTALSLLDNCSFQYDTAGYGGGVYFSSPAPVYTGTTTRKLLVSGPGIVFDNNVAWYNGGAIVTNGDSNVFSGTGINDANQQKLVFSGNVAGYAGGAIYSNTVFNNNLSINWAEFWSNYVHVFNTAFHGSVLGGGAIYTLTTDSIRGTDFIGNHADTANGGAVYISNPQPRFNRYFGEAPTPADSATANDTLSDPRDRRGLFKIMPLATRRKMYYECPL